MWAQTTREVGWDRVATPQIRPGLEIDDHLTGGWATPLKNILLFVNWDDDIPNIWKNILKNNYQPNHQPEALFLPGND